MAGKGDRARHTVNDTWRENYDRVFAKKPILHCAGRCGDVEQDPCERCGGCDRERPNAGHGTDNWCDPTKK